MTEGDLAAKLGVSLQSVNSVVRQRENTSLKKLKRYADALNVSVSELFDDNPWQMAKEAGVITTCGQCEHVEEYWKENTLTVHGRKPTMGTCPYWTESKRVLLSQRSCEHFKYDREKY